MTPELQTIARKSVLLASMPERVRERVLGEARPREFERGATIFVQGERAVAIYVVVEGWVKLSRMTPSGAEAVVAVYSRGASFGEAVAFRNDVYPVTAEAASDCRLIRLDAEAMLRQISENPQVAVSILAATFAHLHSLVAQIEGLKARSGAQRVAEFLLQLSPVTEGACRVVLPYDKGLMAGRLGMKPESLSRAFARLKGQGVDIRHNLAEIADVAALRDYVAGDAALSG